MVRQDVLFAEESVAEAGLWCRLADGLDPVQWARLCRFLGHLTPPEFRRVFEAIGQALNGCPEHRDRPQRSSPTPLVSLGPSGLDGPYQRQW